MDEKRWIRLPPLSSTVTTSPFGAVAIPLRESKLRDDAANSPSPVPANPQAQLAATVQISASWPPATPRPRARWTLEVPFQVELLDAPGLDRVEPAGAEREGLDALELAPLGARRAELHDELLARVRGRSQRREHGEARERATEPPNTDPRSTHRLAARS